MATPFHGGMMFLQIRSVSIHAELRCAAPDPQRPARGLDQLREQPEPLAEMVVRV